MFKKINKDFAWGEKPVPLIPEALINLKHHERWLSCALRKRQSTWRGMTFKDMDSSIWLKRGNLDYNDIFQLLGALLKRSLCDLSEQPLVSDAFLVNFDLSPHFKNTKVKSLYRMLIDKNKSIHNCFYQHLIGLPGVGPKTLLELVCVIEAISENTHALEVEIEEADPEDVFYDGDGNKLYFSDFCDPAELRGLNKPKDLNDEKIFAPGNSRNFTTANRSRPSRDVYSKKSEEAVIKKPVKLGPRFKKNRLSLDEFDHFNGFSGASVENPLTVDFDFKAYDNSLYCSKLNGGNNDPEYASFLAQEPWKHSLGDGSLKRGLTFKGGSGIINNDHLLTI